jgi:NAD(P)-dependent dehydrogenase (short-subunit alcohol dehydrogenase family)
VAPPDDARDSRSAFTTLALAPTPTTRARTPRETSAWMMATLSTAMTSALRPRATRAMTSACRRRAAASTRAMATSDVSASASSSSDVSSAPPAPDVVRSEHVSLVQGASRGIGLEMVRQLLERENPMPGRDAARGGRVVATCRDPAAARSLADLRERYPTRLAVHRLDVTDEASIVAVAESVKASHGRVDVLSNVAAVLHVAGEMTPETSINRVDPDAMVRAYRVNALGPVLVTKAFQAMLMEATAKSVAGGGGGESGESGESGGGCHAIVANLSARVSSVGDNGMGGWCVFSFFFSSFFTPPPTASPRDDRSFVPFDAIPFDRHRPARSPARPPGTRTARRRRR